MFGVLTTIRPPGARSRAALESASQGAGTCSMTSNEHHPVCLGQALDVFGARLDERHF